MTTFLPRGAKGFFKARYLVTAAASLLLAGCSQSFERFAQNPSDADPVYTASVPKQQQANAGEDAITSKPLASAQTGNQVGGYDYSASNRPPAYKAPLVPQVAASEAPTAGDDGKVTIVPGMTLYGVAKANGLTVAELARANGLKPPYAVQTGQVLRIPGSTTAQAAPATHKKSAGAATTHAVASGDTLSSLSRKYGVPAKAIADANGLKRTASLRIGQSLKIPGGTSATVALKSKAPAKTGTNSEATLAQNDQGTVTEQPAKPIQTAEAKPATQTAGSGQSDPSAAPANTTVATAEPGVMGMRWPVRGKVISNFGEKPNGLKNEGINIAVPEGTSIRAAESGVVAYAGNELKGYGNLILIRHEGGFVTAYAHAKELFVKRGDTVKRGDVIAKAGQTGSVSSPQLHFEVRRGATALDPVKYLASATAAN
ncbi:MAG: LysM peptidoglycan-binding domain-containing M23 family metallopeptidase [Rhizobiales bacterium]|nr:LysM peptidoglycan-binding domain-containing M23 family metallopeptidase [Hyphomicrobiales bacterium]MBI3673221.1 LysM peptidoglycan-binding domain-containing M23 family metallopeptidase [Hyphomicrobiales bacterium]